MADDDSIDMPATRRFPPSRIPAVPARWRRVVAALWVVLVVASIVACTAAARRSWHATHDVDQPIAAVGLQQASDVIEGVTDPLLMAPATEAVDNAWSESPARIVAVSGRPVPPGVDLDTVAGLLAGAPGVIPVTFTDTDGKTFTLRLPRNAAIAAKVYDGISPDLTFAIVFGSFLFTGVALLVCAILLFLRRRAEPVALLVSFSLIGNTTNTIAMTLWSSLGWPNVPTVITLLSFALLMLALPAFPDGTYRSRIGAWFAVLAGPVYAVIFLTMHSNVSSIVSYVFFLSAALFPLARFWRSPAGVERQQLKWAGVGVIAAVVITACGSALSLSGENGVLPESLAPILMIVGMAIILVGKIALAIGLTVALMRLALWDADKAIGKSAIVGTLTLALGGLWAAVSIFSNDLMAALFGQTNKGAVAAGSAVVAAAIIGPARGKVTGWIDKRFQASVNALKAIPDQIRAWQASDTPEDVGRRVIATITGKLKAEGAALAVFGEGGYRTVAAHGVDAADVDAWLATLGDAPIDPIVFHDPMFAYRFALADAGDPVGLLLVARRAGGAGFAGDEIAAMKGLATPLSAALRLAHRREQRDRRTAETMAAIERRMVALEHQPA